LLTATKSNEIGQLVDINYRVSFKHLVTKLNFQWIKWLEKMVEPRYTDRYSNAFAALEAMPVHPIRVPEVKLSQINLELKATKLGEKLTQVITINNAVPETMLAGRWEVAAHLSDPPHNPNYHNWISVQPVEFESNQTECKISVDTSKLMAGKNFMRQLLLHTNSLPETYYLNLQVQTAPIPIKTKKLPVSFLSIQFLLSLMMSWIISWSVVISGTLAGDSAIAGLGTAAGAAVGMQAAAWAMSAAGINMGATVAAIAGAALGITALAMAWAGTLAVAGKVAIVGAAVGIVSGLIIGMVTGIAVENLIRRRLSKEFALWLALLTTAGGSSFGLCLGTGFLNPLIMGVMALTNLPLAATLIYLPLRKARLIGDYRQAEQHLIKP
ncbi:MAG: serine/threonine protein kinase, partial [Merismopedia sp. SIO2A8]|nr:serine/threonine protein kinase [Merismopedia sp. SIO2A8]